MQKVNYIVLSNIARKGEQWIYDYNIAIDTNTIDISSAIDGSKTISLSDDGDGVKIKGKYYSYSEVYEMLLLLNTYSSNSNLGEYQIFRGEQ